MLCPPNPGQAPAIPSNAATWSLLGPDTYLYPDAEELELPLVSPVGDGTRQWFVWARGVTMGASSEQTPSQILQNGDRWSPYKLVVTPSGSPGLPDRYIVDIGAGCTIVTPPAPALDVSLLVPVDTAYFAGSVDIPLPATILTAFASRLSINAVQLDAPSRQSRRCTCTRMVEIAANSVAAIDVPPHCKRVYILPVFISGGSGAEPLGGEWHTANNGVYDFYAGPLLLGEWAPVPGNASTLEIYGDPVDTTRANVIFELEV